MGVCSTHGGQSGAGSLELELDGCELSMTARSPTRVLHECTRRSRHSQQEQELVSVQLPSQWLWATDAGNQIGPPGRAAAPGTSEPCRWPPHLILLIQGPSLGLELHWLASEPQGIPLPQLLECWHGRTTPGRCDRGSSCPAARPFLLSHLQPGLCQVRQPSGLSPT